MRHVFVLPRDDEIDIAPIELRVEKRVFGGIHFHTYRPQEPPLYPFVPAYFQNYHQQRKPLMKFLKEYTYGLKPKNYLLALHDDATDLESHAISELLIACGAKETLIEYRAFLLSAKPQYIAVTSSKRAVTVTRVDTMQADTERIFIPIHEADTDIVHDAIVDLDYENNLPVYTFGLSEQFAGLGKSVKASRILQNFIRVL
ncbi:MAG: hypothetical protein MJ071_04110 [Oscillospiraceae bacterium]|nr:hypothetical protein [Oscillospiraceae bacterium]